MNMAETWRAIPLVLPPIWTREDPEYGDFVVFRSVGLLVLVTARIEKDGQRWLHVSVSHKNRMPTWEELRHVKDVFVGRDREALQILPPESEYVNCHPNVLHLWHCLDDRVCPDFREDGLI